MTVRPKPPPEPLAGFDENPPLDATFFARARPAAPGEAARLRAALEWIVKAHDAGRRMNQAISEARKVLAGA
ncbi:MAG: hypothetical protein H5U19_07195 [Rhodobacteraceae bacterium]|nr:hypothetical protein [Paracoccaceae bacterium]